MKPDRDIVVDAKVPKRVDRYFRTVGNTGDAALAARDGHLLGEDDAFGGNLERFINGRRIFLPHHLVFVGIVVQTGGDVPGALPRRYQAANFPLEFVEILVILRCDDDAVGVIKLIFISIPPRSEVQSVLQSRQLLLRFRVGFRLHHHFVVVAVAPLGRAFDENNALTGSGKSAGDDLVGLQRGLEADDAELGDVEPVERVAAGRGRHLNRRTVGEYLLFGVVDIDADLITDKFR
ncbi:hypothetical protein D3C80_914200 [compost metagenome]